MMVKPYILFSNAELNAISASIEGNLMRWVESVFHGAVIEQMHVLQAFENKDGSIDLLYQRSDDEQSCARVIDKSVVVKVTTASNQWINWLGITTDHKHKAHPKNSLLREEIAILLNAIAIDLVTNICPSVYPARVEAREDDDSLIRCAGIKGYGVLLGRLKLEDFVIEFLIDGHLFKPVTKNNVSDKKNLQPIGNRLSSCADLPVKLSAFLGSIDLSIGDIEKINKGDVIKIEHSIYEPVSLTTSAGHVVCRGNLGVKDGNKALSVIS